jgi:hypothetical protein
MTYFSQTQPNPAEGPQADEITAAEYLELTAEYPMAPIEHEEDDTYVRLDLTPEWVPVESSNIAAYASREDRLFVRFHRGTVYQYSGVGSDLIDEIFTRAESCGKAFSSLIVKGGFPALRLN